MSNIEQDKDKTQAPNTDKSDGSTTVPPTGDKTDANSNEHDVEYYKKQYSESSKEALTLKQEINQARKELEDYRKVAEIVAGDPELLNKVREKATTPVTANVVNTGNNAADKTTRELAVKMEQLENALQEKEIDSFKQKHGLDKLPPERWAKVQAAMGEVMKDLLPGGARIPVEKTGTVLESTWKLAKDKLDADTLKDVESSTNLADELGKMRQVPSSGKSGSDNKSELSPKEKEIAAKLGIDPADYAANKI